MDVAVRTQLLRIRQLLEEAQSRAQDSSPVGGHVALILLDGVCESAMRLAAGHRGIALGARAPFERVYSDLKSAFSGWRGEGWGDVSDMHSARNLAQHRAITPDPADVARWSAGADRFVGSLVSAAFGVQLHEVLLADSVDASTIRELLEHAERALDEEDPAASLAASLEAFDNAREGWRDQRASAIDPIRLYRSSLGITETDAANKAIQQLDDLTEVLPFAASLGEYIWLLARRDDLNREVAPSVEEARRALLFVIGWVLRWEAFSARYAGRRYRDRAQRDPRRTGHDDDAVIYSVRSVERRPARPLEERVDEFNVEFELANLPENDLDTWVRLLNKNLSRAEPDMLEGSAPEHASATHDGRVLVWNVAGTTTPEMLVAWVERALTAATTELEDVARRRVEWERTREGVLSQYKDALESIAFDGTALFSGFRVEGGIGENASPAFTVVGEAPAMAQDQVGLELWQVLNEFNVSVGSEIGFSGDAWEIRSSATPKQAAELIRRVTTKLEQRLAAVEEQAVAEESVRAAFEKGLVAAIETERARNP